MNYSKMLGAVLPMPSPILPVWLPEYNKAKKRYEDEVNDGTLRESLEDLQKHLDDPGRDWSDPSCDLTDEIDEWLKQYEDMFDKLYEDVQSDPYSLEKQKALWMTFYETVKTGGPMDIKDSENWMKAFGFTSPNDTDYQYFLYHGQVVDSGTLGNIVYAYIGAKYFPEYALYAGGGYAQIKNRNKTDLVWLPLLPNCGDMPEDHQAIELGIKWRKEGFPN